MKRLLKPRFSKEYGVLCFSHPYPIGDLMKDDHRTKKQLVDELTELCSQNAARILRQDKETRDIPIVFVTSSVMAEGRAEIDDITNTGFVSKPINTRTFAKEISQYIK